VSCDDVREVLEAYALRVLDQEEQARVEAHLASCADCRTLADRYADILAGLPEALALASPLRLPETIKPRLLAALEGVAAETAAQAPGTTVPRRPRRALRLLAFAGAVALALALASTAALSFALDRERRLKERFAGLLDQRETVLEVVDGRGTQRAFLSSPDARSTAYGKLFTNPRLRQVVVMAGRLPGPQEGRRYRVLLTSGGVTRTPGILKVNARGFGLLVFEAGRAGPRYDAVRVTLEPPAGSPGEGEAVLSWTRERQ
jgi:hypothetical protein